MRKEFIDFVREHEADDVDRLLLSAKRFPGIDVRAAVEQIEGRRTAVGKWPTLLAYDGYRFPPRLNREQSSSEAAARYKADLVAGSGNVADITGGMGVDALFMSRVVSRMHYVERNEELCQTFEENCREVGVENVCVHCGDGVEWIAGYEGSFDVIYADPARRDAHGRRMVAFEHCEPDIVGCLPMLMGRSRRVLVKASPMIDISLGMQQLGCVREVHVVAVGGECKEVLFLCSPSAEDEPHIMAVNLLPDGREMRFSFGRSEEESAEVEYCERAKRYLYEPHAALMKAGPYKLIGMRYGIEKLGRNTHLYTADNLTRDFPGRCFEVLAETSLTAKAVRKYLPEGKAGVICRGYAERAETLARRLGLRDGGENFLVATTVGAKVVGLVCRLL